MVTCSENESVYVMCNKDDCENKVILEITSIYGILGVVDNCPIPHMHSYKLIQFFRNLPLHTRTCLHADMECNSVNIGKKNILTDNIVKAMTNVFTHESNNQRTYLYVPAKETKRGYEYIFQSTGANPGINHAEDAMYNALRNNLPHEFWLTKTPCPQCARNLIARYANKKKPVIRVTHFYSIPPNGASQKEKSIQCMAKMIKNGFTFLLWDWNKFNKSFLVAPWCTKIVSDAIQKHAKELKAEQDALLAAILKASNYAEESSYHDLCKP